MLAVAVGGGLVATLLQPFEPGQRREDTKGQRASAPESPPAFEPPGDEALIKLSQVDPERPDWGTLRKALSSSRATDRLRALEALSKLEQRQALVFAVAGLRDPEAAVRLQAGRAVEDLWGRRLEESSLTKAEGAASVARYLVLFRYSNVRSVWATTTATAERA